MSRGYYVETAERDDDGDPVEARIVYAEDAWDAAHLLLEFRLMGDVGERMALRFKVYPVRRVVSDGPQPWGGRFDVDTNAEGDKLQPAGRWIHGGEL